MTAEEHLQADIGRLIWQLLVQAATLKAERDRAAEERTRRPTAEEWPPAPGRVGGGPSPASARDE